MQSIHERERLILASYAQFSAASRGRKHPEEEHPYRGPYQRDRDRIVHTAAFRRLADKTQVFTSLSDYHRTRLTHTMEVASIARTISRALRLNEDLTEALALVHDIGHPPYGHAGEDALAELLAAEGGFSHNQYALTIVEELESRSADFPGLNLTYEVLESQTTRIDKNGPARPLFEAQVVDAADSITYDAHDCDDAMKLGLVTLEELIEIPLVHDCSARSLQQRQQNPRLARKMLVRDLIDHQVSDLLQTAGRALQAAGQAFPPVASSFRIGPSPALAAKKEELEKFLYRRVYRHASIVSVREQAARQLRELFAAYLAAPELLPERHRSRIASVGAKRAIGEFIAGMTEGYFHQQHDAVVQPAGADAARAEQR
jgi:dGTPase